jgi:hypothetical protein
MSHSSQARKTASYCDGRVVLQHTRFDCTGGGTRDAPVGNAIRIVGRVLKKENYVGDEPTWNSPCDGYMEPACLANTRGHGGPYMPAPADGSAVHVDEHRSDFISGGVAFDGYTKVATLQLDELGLEFAPASPEELEVQSPNGPFDVCEIGFAHTGIERDASLLRTALGSGALVASSSTDTTASVLTKDAEYLNYAGSTSNTVQ